MSLSAFGTIPPGVLTTPVPFTLDVPHNDQHHLKRLVKDANIAPPSYYTTHTDTTNTTSFGLSRDWLITAQDTWTSHESYSWHDEQAHLNSFPNFRINVTTSTSTPESTEEEEQTFDIHFAALFSQSPTATPLILLHGWPGAWFEFAPLLELLAAKYTPETLPYHVVVPSIPDYGLSTRSRELEQELSMDEAAAAMDALMVQLGFGDATGGYVAQGGDIGSFLTQVMCAHHDGCKAFHVNLYFLTEAQTAAVAGIPITPAEQVQVESAAAWSVKGTSYGNEHGTRPATISLVLSTNPLAMLAWMGEKFIEWSDNRYPIGLNTILSMTSFYWFTESYGRSMWAYRTLMSVIGGSFPTLPFSTTKPFGYSAFHLELGVLPKAWAEHLFSNLVFHKSHDRGGHFAALEQPQLFLEDLEEFMAIVAVNATGSN